METRSEWSSRLRRFASDAGVLSHDFLQAVSKAGPERRAKILRWAQQDYFTSRDFPCILGILISQISDPQTRHPLVLNLWEEHGEGDLLKSHFTLYCNMLESLGLERIVEPGLADKATSEFIERQEAIAHQNLLAGLGAFCYGNEYLAEKEFDAIEEAVKREFPNADCSFFIANREVDGKHTVQTEDVIDSLARTDDDLSDVRRGATIALQARVAFYDSLLR
jgi:pyrroloquinoline quinone (PQQ) biosynthesis protein C